MKKFIFFNLFIFFVLLGSNKCFSATYYSIASTGWTTPSTWSTVGCGGAAAVTIPGIGDDVTICAGTTVIMNGNAGSCRSLTINGVATWTAVRTTNVGVGGITVNSGGNITGAAAGVLATTGGLTLNSTLTSTTVTIKTITAAGQTINGTGSLAKLDISANTINNGNITVRTTLASTAASTLTQSAAATLIYKGTTAITPTLDASAAGNTVNYGGAAQTIKSATYNNLTVSTAGIKTLGGAITVNGNLTVSAGTLSTSAFQITGNASGVFTLAAGTVFNIGNAASATNVTFPTFLTNTMATASRVVYLGNSAQTVASLPTYGNLTIQTFSGSKTADGTINVVGNLVTTSPCTLAISTNTLNLTGTYTGTGGLSFSSGNFNIAGTFTNTGAFTCGTGTVNYNGAGAQAVRGVNYYNLTFSGAGAKTLQAAATIRIAGDFARGAMAVTPGATNTVLFNGGVQNMSGSTTTFTKLTLANTSLTIPANIQVNTTLTFTTGNIITGANLVTLAPAAAVVRTSGHVEGNLRKYISATYRTRTFEVGSGSDYTPLNVTFASVSVAGYLTASTTAGDHPQIASSGFNVAKTVNRYWTVRNTGITFTTYSVTCNFITSDEDAGINTSYCSVKTYNSSIWALPSAGTRTSFSTQAKGLATPLSSKSIDLQIGQIAPVPILISIIPSVGNSGQTLDVLFNGSGYLAGVSYIDTVQGITVNAVTVNADTLITANLTITDTVGGTRLFYVTNPAPGGGVSASKVFTIRVLPIPQFYSNATDIICNIDGNVNFINTSLHANSYQWDFGSGASPATSTNINETVSYSTTGLKTIQLIATNAYGRDTLIKTDYINVTASAPATPGPISGSSNIRGLIFGTYSVDSVPGAVYYTWSIPYGFQISDGQGTRILDVSYPVHYTLTTGVSVVASNACGTSATQTLGITFARTINTTIQTEGSFGIPMTGIYPNPTTNNFYFDLLLDSEQKITVEVYDATGKLLLQQAKTFAGGMMTAAINIEDLKPGIYLVKVIDNDSKNYSSVTLIKQ